MRKSTFLLAMATMWVCTWAASGISVVRPDLSRSKTIAPLNPILVPRMLNYQGKLLDSTGRTVADTLYALQFKLYVVPSGGTAFWTENQMTRTKAGLYSVLLGSVTALDSFPATGICYLGMKVGTDAEMTPRVRIVGAPYAYLAGKADTANYAAEAGATDSAGVSAVSDNSAKLQGKDTTGFVRTGQANSITSTMIGNGTVVRANVALAFKSPYADTADYARSAQDEDSVRIAANAWTLEGKDTTGFVRAGQANGISNAMLQNSAVTSAKIENGTILRANVAPDFKAPYSDTADYSRAAPAVDSTRVAGSAYNSAKLQGKDTADFVRTGQANSVTSTMIGNGTVVRTNVALAFKSPYADTADYALAAPASDSTRVAGSAYNSAKLQGKDTADFVRTGQTNSVTSTMIGTGTVLRTNAASGFKAPYSDTADYAHSALTSDTANYARSAPAVDSTRVAGSAYNSAKLQGKDTTGFVRTGQANSVTSAMITNGTIVTADAASNFKAPYSDTADYSRAAPAVDSTRVAVNAYLLDGNAASAFAAVNHTHPFVDSARVAVNAYNSTTLQGKDTADFVRTNQANSITSAMIGNGTVVRTNVASGFKAPYSDRADTADYAHSALTSDTADYARSAPAVDSTRVAGSAYNSAKLQGKDTTGFVRTGQANGISNAMLQNSAVTSAKIENGTILRANVASEFKAPYSDTADYAHSALTSDTANYARSAPTVDSTRVAANAYLLDGNAASAFAAVNHTHPFVDSARTAVNTYNSAKLQGKDTTNFVRTNQANSVTSTMIGNGTVVRANVATAFQAPYADTAEYARSAPAVDSTRVAGSAYNSAKLQGKDTTGFVRTGQANGISNAMLQNDAVTSAKIENGTILRANVASEFKAPYSDTADYAHSALTSDTANYARSAPAVDSTRVAGSAYNSAKLQGKDTTGFVRTGEANSVTSAMITNGTIVTADAASNFNAPYSDTSDYARSAPPVDSTRVAANAWTLQGKDTADFVRTNQANSVTSTMIGNGTVLRTNVASDFKSPYSDTADYAHSALTSDTANYARSAPSVDSTNVAANAYNSAKLQGKDTTDFVRTGQANSITSTMIGTGTVLQTNVASDFKAPYSDTSDYARSAPAVDSTRVAGSAYNSAKLQGKDTTGFVRTNQANSITSAMIGNGTVARTNVASSFKAPYSDTADYAHSALTSDTANYARSAPPVDSTRVAANAWTLQGKDTAGFVRTNQANSVTSAMITNGTIVTADAASNFKAPYSDTADYSRATPSVDSTNVAANAYNSAKLQGKDTTGFVRTNQASSVTSAMIGNGTVVRTNVVANFKAPYSDRADTADYAHSALTSDTADYARSAPAVDSTRVAGSAYNSAKLQGKDTTGFVRTGQANGISNAMLQNGAVTSAKIEDGTILRANVASDFKAPYSDTADYSRAAPSVDSTNVAANAYNSAKLQGKDTTDFVRTGQANSVTSAMITNGTIVTADAASNFKAPYSDTADYSRAAPAVDSTRVAANAYLLDGNAASAFAAVNHTHPFVDSARVAVNACNSTKLQGKDTADFVRTNQANSITSTMIGNGTVVRTNVASGFKAPYSDRADTADYAHSALTSDTAGYARSAPAVDSTRVAANAYLLDGNAASAFAAVSHTHPFVDSARTAVNAYNSAKLQGKDTTNFVRSNQANSVTSTMIGNGTVVRANVATAFQAPYADTAEYARSAPAVDSTRVAGSSYNSAKLQGKDTTGFVRTGQANSVTSAMIGNGTVLRTNVASNFKAPYSDTADYAHSALTSDTANYARSAPAVDSTRVAGSAYNSAKLQGKDTTGFVRTGQANGISNAMLQNSAVTSAKIENGTILRTNVASDFKAPYSDTADYAHSALTSDTANYARSAPTVDSTRVAVNAWTLQGKDTTGFVRTGEANSVTSAMITNGTIVTADAASNFKAPYSDTADYSRATPSVDSTRVAGSAYNSAKLQGKDTTGFVRTGQANSVTSAMIGNGTVVRTNVAASFKAPYSDTADYSRATPSVDSTNVAANAYNSAKLQGKDTTGFVRTNQANSVTSTMIGTGTVLRTNVASSFKAPYSDTADYAHSALTSDTANYARSAPAVDSTRVAGSAYNSAKLQGKDTTGFVRTGQANSVTSTMIGNGTVLRTNVASDFKSPYSDTADYAHTALTSDTADYARSALTSDTANYARSAPAVDSVRVAVNAYNSMKLQGKDTADFVRTNQANSITSTMIGNGTVVRTNVASGFKAPYSDRADTADYAHSALASDTANYARSAPSVDSTNVAANAYNSAKLQGKDTTGFVRTNQANSVTSTMIGTGTVLRTNVASSFKAPYSDRADTADYAHSALTSDTADYARSAPAVDSTRVAANAYNSAKLQGKDTTDFVRTGQANSVTSAMITNGTIVTADAASNFNAPYSDTSDYAHSALTSDTANYARSAPAVDSTRVAGSAYNSAKLQGKDTTGFVRTGQANSVTSAMITNGTVVTADAASNFKAPYSDTADYSRAAPAVDSTRVAANAYLLDGNAASAFAAVNHTHPFVDSARIAVNAYNSTTLQGKDTTALDARYVNESQSAGGDLTGTYPNPTIGTGRVDSVRLAAGAVTMSKLNQAGATDGQVLKWTGSAWAPRNDSVGGYNAWVHGDDSVLYTIRQLGIARGGSGNALFGNLAFTHTNLGVACTTGTSGEDYGYCAVGGGLSNTASGFLATVSGGDSNTAGESLATVSGGGDNVASEEGATVGGGYMNLASGTAATVSGGYNDSASGFLATVSGGEQNTASGDHAAVGGGYGCSAAGDYSFAVNNGSQAVHDNSAAFSGSTTTAPDQVRCVSLVQGDGIFTSDHPLDPSGKLLNQYAMGSSELVMFYRGAATIGSDGRVQVQLPNYFDAYTRNPMVQLTGVGTPDVVYVAEDVTGNQFVIGGKPGTKVYWTVTGERKDVQAEIARILTPTEQPKTGVLRDVMVDDDALVGTMQTLEQMGKAGEFSFRTAAGRQRYEDMLKQLREAEQHKNAQPVQPRGVRKQPEPSSQPQKPQQ